MVAVHQLHGTLHTMTEIFKSTYTHAIPVLTEDTFCFTCFSLTVLLLVSEADGLRICMDTECLDTTDNTLHHLKGW